MTVTLVSVPRVAVTVTPAEGSAAFAPLAGESPTTGPAGVAVTEGLPPFPGAAVALAFAAWLADPLPFALVHAATSEGNAIAAMTSSRLFVRPLLPRIDRTSVHPFSSLRAINPSPLNARRTRARGIAPSGTTLPDGLDLSGLRDQPAR